MWLPHPKHPTPAKVHPGISSMAEALGGEGNPSLAQLWDQLALLQFIQVQWSPR